jgi:imidazolonepropionase-like amidohydrolase
MNRGRTSVRISALASLLVLAAAPTAAATEGDPGAGPKERSARPLAIVDTTIIPVSDPIIHHGTVLTRNGKIEAVGRSVDLPDDARVINGKNLYVMPGIVDTHSHLGVYALPEVSPHADGNEWTDPITPHVRAIDAVHGGDPAITRSLTGGVTTVQIVPGSANIVGGQSVVIKRHEAGLRGESQEGLRRPPAAQPRIPHGKRRRAARGAGRGARLPAQVERLSRGEGKGRERGRIPAVR